MGRARGRAEEEQAEFRRGSAAASKSRATVSAQFAELMAARELTGSREHLVERVRGVVEAEGQGDLFALRAAVMELTVAGGAWIVALDLSAGDPSRPRATVARPTNGRGAR